MRFPFLPSLNVTPQVAPTAVAALQAQSPGLILLDVRTLAEFEAGHLPGSSLVPVEQVASARPALQQAGHPVLIVCQSGARAALAARTLQSGGMTGISVLAGGVAAWRRHGLPLEFGRVTHPLRSAAAAGVHTAPTRP